MRINYSEVSLNITWETQKMFLEYLKNDNKGS